MASLRITPEQNMMNMILESIYKDIKNGNCKPMEATRRYNSTARTMSLPPADEATIKEFKKIRKKFNLQRRRARESLITRARSVGLWADETQQALQRANTILQQTANEVREASTGTFRSVPPPRAIRRRTPTNTIVPPVPDDRGGGESKSNEIPIATNVVCIVNEWEIDPNIPYAIAVV